MAEEKQQSRQASLTLQVMNGNELESGRAAKCLFSENGGDISDEWDICVSKSGYLKEDDRQILSELGRTIGKSNTDGETAVLALAGQRLSFQLKTAEEERKRKGRLYTTLGIMLGAAVGIMLI